MPGTTATWPRRKLSRSSTPAPPDHHQHAAHAGLARLKLIECRVRCELRQVWVMSNQCGTDLQLKAYEAAGPVCPF